MQYCWDIALVIFFIRLFMIALATISGAYAANDPKPQRYLYWLGFIAQAGVTLGFAYEIARRFPDWGGEIDSIIVAVVAINQIIGPITFKFALEKGKEARGKIDYKTLIQMNNK